MRRCPDINKAINKFNYNPNIDLEGLKRFLIGQKKIIRTCLI